VKKFFTNKEPLCYAMQALAFWGAKFGKDARVLHIPGKKNGLADHISRWRRHPQTIGMLRPDREEKIQLWEIFQHVWG